MIIGPHWRLWIHQKEHMDSRWLLCCYLQAASKKRGVCTSKIPRQHDMIVMSVLIALYMQRVKSHGYLVFLFLNTLRTTNSRILWTLLSTIDDALRYEIHGMV